MYLLNSIEHNDIAEKIRAFLNLNQPSNDDTEDSSSEEGEDGFEHITEEAIEEELKTDHQNEEN